MKTLLLLVLCPLLNFAQQVQEATTEITEKRVLLFPNGTWMYKDKNLNSQLLASNGNETTLTKNKKGFLTDESGREWNVNIIEERERDIVVTAAVVRIARDNKNIALAPHRTYEFVDYGNYKNYVFSKNNITMIRFEDNTRDVFKKNIKENAPMSNIDYSILGKAHSGKYYRNYSAPFQLSMWSAIIGSPVLGIVTPVLYNKRKSLNEKTLIFPDAELMKNSDYKKSYIEASLKKKKLRSWIGYGIGSVINLSAVGLIIYAANQ